MAVDVIKEHYLREHVLVRARSMDLNDRALDEYLGSLLKQGAHSMVSQQTPNRNRPTTGLFIAP